MAIGLKSSSQVKSTGQFLSNLFFCFWKKTKLNCSVLLVLGILICCNQSQMISAQEIEAEDLLRGIIAKYQDNATPPNTIQMIESIVGFNLGENQSPHPRLSANGGIYRYDGYIKIMRNGAYSFAANLRGSVVVKINDRIVFQNECKSAKAEYKQIDGVNLTSGIYPINIEFKRLPGAARLELMWKMPGQLFEILPYDQLGFILKQWTGEVKEDTVQEFGRILFEEMSCIRCHAGGMKQAVSKTLIDRHGPDLKNINSRVYSAWLETWLKNPKGVRPNTKMPALFANNEQGQSEITAVIQYLASLGGNSPKEQTMRNIGELNRRRNQGKIAFTTFGCQACHESPEKQTAKENMESAKQGKKEGEVKPTVYGLISSDLGHQIYNLGKLENKTTVGQVTHFLMNPLEHNNTSRMPGMNLNENDARNLAIYLCTQPLRKNQKIDSMEKDLKKPTSAPNSAMVEKVMAELKMDQAEIKNFGKMPLEKQWQNYGKMVFQIRHCANCHEIDTQAKLVAKMSVPLEEIGARAEQGCLSETAKESDRFPHFSLKSTERKAIQSFLKNGLKGVGSDAPIYQAKRTITRLNCLNCHQKEGEGGVGSELVEQMQRFEKAENLDDVRPPNLTGIGHKFLSPWTKKIFLEAGRARPWMSLRMPQYGEKNIGVLVNHLAEIEGSEAISEIQKPILTAKNVEVGRQIVGKNGLGCISCHDIAGIANRGTRGPDLATTNQRVRYDWFRKWLEQPQRMTPNTRMPQIFIDGKTSFTVHFKDDPEAQTTAIWSYLSLGPTLPLPVGLEPPKGLIIPVGKDLEILRTFMPNAGNRAIAVGFPGGTNFAFDSNQCRLAYAWAGNFLDASPVWDNRGGAPAKILGPTFYTAPEGNPWAVSDSQSTPDFAERTKNPSYGVPEPLMTLFKGKRYVHFEGYELNSDGGTPIFKYRVENENNASAHFEEKVQPLPQSIASGIVREFSIQAPKQQNIWFLAGTSSQLPKFANYSGAIMKIDSKETTIEQPIEDKMVIIPTEASKAVVLSLQTEWKEAVWRIEPKTGGGYSILVHFPKSDKEVKAKAKLFIWNVGSTTPDFLKGLPPKSSR